MGKNEKRLLLSLITLSIVSLIFSTSNLLSLFTKTVPDTGGIYREGVIGQPRFINPIFATSETDKSLVNLVYSGLFKFDHVGAVVPDLAMGFPEITGEGLIYTVKLKAGKWHNGLPITANDVVFTIKAIQNSQYNSPKRVEWLSTNAEAIDEHTVKFTLKDASGPFLNNLTLPIISEVVWNKTAPSDAVLSQGNIEAVGNGPYRIKEVKKLAEGSIQTVTLESFADFHSQPSFLDTLKINFYQNPEDLLKALHGKQIDGLGFNSFSEKISIKQSLKDLAVYQIPLPQYTAVFINTTNKVLGDRRIRTAMNLATNKQGVLDQIYEGQGQIIDSPILSQQVGNLPQAQNDFNLESAKTLLNQAGWTIPEGSNIRKKGSQELKFTLATNDTVLNVSTAEALIDQWKKLGIEITLNSLPTKELNEVTIKPRSYDLLLFAQKLGSDPDPFIFWHSSQAKNPGLNLSNYVNQSVDKLISEARVTNNKTERDQKYLQIHDTIKQDLPAIFLVQSVYTYALQNDIRGFGIQSMPEENTRFFDLRNWYTDTKRVLK